jgi:hypothetical protein
VDESVKNKEPTKQTKKTSTVQTSIHIQWAQSCRILVNYVRGVTPKATPNTLQQL